MHRVVIAVWMRPRQMSLKLLSALVLARAQYQGQPLHEGSELTLELSEYLDNLLLEPELWSLECCPRGGWWADISEVSFEQIKSFKRLVRKSKALQSVVALSQGQLCESAMVFSHRQTQSFSFGTEEFLGIPLAFIEWALALDGHEWTPSQRLEANLLIDVARREAKENLESLPIGPEPDILVYLEHN